MFLIRCLIINIIVICIISCDNKGELKGKAVVMGELEHRKSAGDYEFIIRSKGILKAPIVWQNRIEKVIYIKLPGLNVEAVEEQLNIGLLKGFVVREGLISISLSRPLRYDIKMLGNSGFVISLKNINFLSSIEPVSGVSDDIHRSSFVIDLHNDLAFHLFVNGSSLGIGGLSTESDIIKLRKGGIKAVFFAIWVPSFYMQGASSSSKVSSRHKMYLKRKEYIGRPFSFALSMIRRLKEEIGHNSDSIMFVDSVAGIESANRAGKIAALIGLEGLHSLEGRLDRLDILYNVGVRYIGLTWSNTNEFADSSTDIRKHGGLSLIGKDFVRSCMEKGILIDISHSSNETVYDTMEISGYDYPLIASHSAVKSIKEHKRNLSDDIIRSLHKTNGIIGLVFHSPFIVNRANKSTKTARATIEDVLDHIDYIVETASINNIALGSDFDGFISPPLGLEDMSKVPNLSLGLYNRGYSKIEIAKILGGNFISLLRRVENRKENSE